MRAYEVQLEIAGPAAMFTRPDTGAENILLEGSGKLE